MRSNLCINRLWALLPVAALVTACATTAQRPVALIEAEDVYASIAADPQVTAQAAAELQLASDTLEQARRLEQSDADHATVAHVAYLAKQRARTAREIANAKLAQREIELASAERNEILLQARARDADLARQQAADHATAAERARQQAADLQAEITRREANEQALQARIAREQAEEQARIAERERIAEEARLATERAAQAQERTELLERELSDLQAERTARGIVVTLPEVLFDVGRATLSPGAQRTLDRLAQVMRQYPELTLQAEGFTDSTGSEDYNMMLSQARANSVREALVARGIDPGRILAQGYGETMPIASNATAAGRQQNRRVEIVIADVPQQRDQAVGGFTTEPKGQPEPSGQRWESERGSIRMGR